MGRSFFFFDWLKSWSDLWLQRESGLFCHVGRPIMIFSSPHLCHRGIKLYLPSRWACCAAGEILHFSCISKTLNINSSAPGGWLTDWELSWHLRFEMRGLCSQHIPCFIFMWLSSIFLLGKMFFLLEKKVSWQHFCALWGVKWRQKRDQI